MDACKHAYTCMCMHLCPEILFLLYVLCSIFYAIFTVFLNFEHSGMLQCLDIKFYCYRYAIIICFYYIEIITAVIFLCMPQLPGINAS